MGKTSLAEFTIGSQEAELALQKVDGLLKLVNMNASDLKKTLSALFVDHAGKLGDSNKKTAEGTEGIKTYRQEQRLQDYVIRQTTQSLTSMIFALGFLSQGQDKAGSTTHKVTTSLLTGVAAMEAVEFSMFGIGEAGKRMGGTVGGLMEKFSKWGGPIAIAVGAIATLVAWLHLADETAQKASEAGLESFSQKFAKLSRGGQSGTIAQLKSDIKGLQTDAEALVAVRITGYRSQFGPTSTTVITDQARYNALQKEIAAKDQLLKKAEEEAKQQTANLKAIKDADDALKGHYTTVQEINNALAIRNQETQEGVDLVTREALTQEQIRKRLDEIEKLTFQRTQLLKTSTQLAAEEQKRQEKRLETTKQIAEADQKLFESAGATELDNILNVYARQRAQEDQRHTEKLANIEEEAARANELGVDAFGNRIFTGDAARAMQAEKERNSQANIVIGRSEAEEIGRIKVDAIQNEEQKIKAKFDFEKRLVNESADSEELKRAKIAKLELEKSTALHQNELQFLDDISQGFQAITAGLQSMGANADNVLVRLVQMAQIAIRVATMISNISAKSEGGSTGDYLSIIGNLLGFVGLFDSGGWTGSGSRNQVAGLVHKDEIVFEQPLVQRYRSELLSLRRSLQLGNSMRAAMPASDNGNLATMVLVSEIRSLKAAIRSMPIEVNPIFRNVLDTQKILREEMPGYEKFQSNKQVDSSK